MKYKKIMALVVAVITITMAFAPAAMAVTNATRSWGYWPVQGTENFSTRYAYAINRFLRIYYKNAIPSGYNEYYNGLVDSSGKANGDFSYSTYKMVKKFQSDWNSINGDTGTSLAVDGAVGPYTWLAMRTYLSNAYTSEAGTTLAPNEYTGDMYYKVFNKSQATYLTFAFKWGSSQRWLVNRIDNGVYNYIYS